MYSEPDVNIEWVLAKSRIRSCLFSLLAMRFLLLQSSLFIEFGRCIAYLIYSILLAEFWRNSAILAQSAIYAV